MSYTSRQQMGHFSPICFFQKAITEDGWLGVKMSIFIHILIYRDNTNILRDHPHFHLRQV